MSAIKVDQKFVEIIDSYVLAAHEENSPDRLDMLRHVDQIAHRYNFSFYNAMLFVVQSRPPTRQDYVAMCNNCPRCSLISWLQSRKISRRRKQGGKTT
jgi:hypothetical protein